jgi:hypothetical protein
MKRTTLSFFLLITFVGISFQPHPRLFGQSQDALQTGDVAEIQQRLNQLQANLEDKGTLAQTAVATHDYTGQDQRILARYLSISIKNAKQLNKDFKATPPSAEYERSLDDNLELLNRIEVEPDQLKKMSLLLSVSEDIKIKATYNDKTASKNSDVVVTAKTKRGGQEVPGLEVWYVHRGWADTPTKFKRFDRRSSPTEDKPIPPGYYYFWTQDPDNAASQGGREPIDLGDDGKSKREIDLRAP